MRIDLDNFDVKIVEIVLILVWWSPRATFMVNKVTMFKRFRRNLLKSNIKHEGTWWYGVGRVTWKIIKCSNCIYNGTVRKASQNNTNSLGTCRVSISQFHSGLGWDTHRKLWHAICDCNICSSIFMKQRSKDCIKFWSMGKRNSSLKHLEVNTQKVFIMFWVEEFQGMVHLIIINLFDRSGVWIWNRFRVIFNCKLLRLNLNITIINFMTINFSHDSWNYRDDFGRRCTEFEVSFWSLDVPLYWWLIWFFTMKEFELIIGGQQYEFWVPQLQWLKDKMKWVDVQVWKCMSEMHVWGAHLRSMSGCTHEESRNILTLHLVYNLGEHQFKQ